MLFVSLIVFYGHANNKNDLWARLHVYCNISRNEVILGTSNLLLTSFYTKLVVSPMLMLPLILMMRLAVSYMAYTELFENL